MVGIASDLSWEYEQFTFEQWKPDQKWACLAAQSRAQDDHIASIARQVFWQEAREQVMERVQGWLDDRWEPAEAIGPEAIALEKTETTKTGFGLEDVFVWVLTLGIALIIQLALGASKKRYLCFTPKVLSITMRRVCATEKTEAPISPVQLKQRQSLLPKHPLSV